MTVSVGLCRQRVQMFREIHEDKGDAHDGTEVINEETRALLTRNPQGGLQVAPRYPRPSGPHVRRQKSRQRFMLPLTKLRDEGAVRKTV